MTNMTREELLKQRLLVIKKELRKENLKMLIKQSKWLILFLVLLGWFYWFQFRPIKIQEKQQDIRLNCVSVAEKRANEVYINKIKGYISEIELLPCNYTSDCNLKESYLVKANNLLKVAVSKGVYLPEDYDDNFERCLKINNL
jgi:hypothetical protein